MMKHCSHGGNAEWIFSVFSNANQLLAPCVPLNYHMGSLFDTTVSDDANLLRHQLVLLLESHENTIECERYLGANTASDTLNTVSKWQCVAFSSRAAVGTATNVGMSTREEETEEEVEEEDTTTTTTTTAPQLSSNPEEVEEVTTNRNKNSKI